MTSILRQSSSHVDSSAILILAILRHLESGQGENYSLDIHKKLRKSCLSLLTHPELKVSVDHCASNNPELIIPYLQVRQAAAEAAASLTPKATRLSCCDELLASLPGSMNGCHGHLLLVLSLLTVGAQPDSEAGGRMLGSLRACLDDRKFPPLIMTIATEIAGRFMASAPSAAQAILRSFETAPVGSSSAPGASLWTRAYRDLGLPKSQVAPQQSSSFLRRALQPGASPDERIQALEEFQASPGADDPTFDRNDLFDRLAELYAKTAHVPVRESILPALGMALVGFVTFLRSARSRLILRVGSEFPAGPYQRRSRLD